MFSFSKPKISFTEMFHESIEKQFNWNLMLRYSVKSTLNQYFMKCSQRKISVYPSLKVSLSFSIFLYGKQSYRDEINIIIF